MPRIRTVPNNKLVQIRHRGFKFVACLHLLKNLEFRKKVKHEVRDVPRPHVGILGLNVLGVGYKRLSCADGRVERAVVIKRVMI